MISGIFYFLRRLIEFIIDIFCDYGCKYYVTHSKKTYFKRTAKVENLSKDKTKIEVGSNTIIRGELLVFKHGGEIWIGDYCYVGEGTIIRASISVRIGDRVLISHGVNIHDNNAHPFDSKERHLQYKQIISSGHPQVDNSFRQKEVVICDDVWIGFGATILKGVTIGKGAIVAANALVTKDVPDKCIVGGNPAEIIRYL